MAGLMKTDPAIKKSETGLYYKIEKEGEGEAIGDNTPLLVNHTGRFLPMAKSLTQARAIPPASWPVA